MTTFALRNDSERGEVTMTTTDELTRERDDLREIGRMQKERAGAHRQQQSPTETEPDTATASAERRAHYTVGRREYSASIR